MNLMNIFKAWSESHSVVSDSLWPHGIYSAWNSPGQNNGVVAFPFSRGSSQPMDLPRSPALQADSLPAEHKGSPRILEWVAYPFSSTSSWPRNQTRVSCIAGWFFYQLNYQGNVVKLQVTSDKTQTRSVHKQCVYTNPGNLKGQSVILPSPYPDWFYESIKKRWTSL